MLLATLYPQYDADGFDLEVATETPKRLVANKEQAKQWAKAEMAEGREPQEWAESEHPGTEQSQTWEYELDCNEYGEPETWILVVETVEPY